MLKCSVTEWLCVLTVCESCCFRRFNLKILCRFNSQLQPLDDGRTSMFESPVASMPSSGRNTPAQLSDVVIRTFVLLSF